MKLFIFNPLALHEVHCRCAVKVKFREKATVIFCHGEYIRNSKIPDMLVFVQQSLVLQ